ncbi:MAG: PIN-like domain-containing protein [Lachnospiraceae bacterium]|nr:PIN-like domain-containing protein [Lachnospiraceae bacterium]
MSGRIWIPAQAWFEFLKNREKVVKKPSQSYDLLLTKAKDNKDSGYVEKIKIAAVALGKDNLSDISGQLTTLKEKTAKQDQHPYFDAGIYNKIDSALDTIKGGITEFQHEVDEFVQTITRAAEEKKRELEAGEDIVLQTIQSNFSLGKEFTYEEMMEL